MNRRKPAKRKLRDQHAAGVADTALRIVGGRFRGRRLTYSGDRRTRPMKDRVRQAMFDLLGPGLRGTHAIDLFGGTGILALEAISRGASRATIIEQHFPSARLIETNAAALGASEMTEVVGADTFLWVKMATHDLEIPWTVFCSPPYQFYHERVDDVLQLLQTLIDLAPARSNFIVESDTEFDPERLPCVERWTIRDHAPARLAIYRDHSTSDVG